MLAIYLYFGGIAFIIGMVVWAILQESRELHNLQSFAAPTATDPYRTPAIQTPEEVKPQVIKEKKMSNNKKYGAMTVAITASSVISLLCYAVFYDVVNTALKVCVPIAILGFIIGTSLATEFFMTEDK